MQTIPAASGNRVIERHVQVIPPQEPFKDAVCTIAPLPIAGHPVGFQAGRDRRLGLDRLLIEAGPLLAPRVETIRADWNEMPSAGLAKLKVHKPRK